MGRGDGGINGECIGASKWRRPPSKRATLIFRDDSSRGWNGCVEPSSTTRQRGGMHICKHGCGRAREVFGGGQQISRQCWQYHVGPRHFQRALSEPPTPNAFWLALLYEAEEHLNPFAVLNAVGVCRGVTDIVGHVAVVPFYPIPRESLDGPRRECPGQQDNSLHGNPPVLRSTDSLPY